MERLHFLSKLSQTPVYPPQTFSQTCTSQQWKKRKLGHATVYTRAKLTGADAAQYITAGPGDSPPDYTSIDAQPLSRVITQLFRQKMVAQLGVDSKHQG